MLFNSFNFLLFFLPVVVSGFFYLAKRGELWGASWLAAASLFFYGWWDYHYIPLLLASIVCNYLCGYRIATANKINKKLWLIIAIVINLTLLAYYKYANFLLSSINQFGGTEFDLKAISLPIGISFFTFTQIAFLVDTYQGKVKEYRFVHYLLFVTYFPHLIAGPVLHHKEMMPQFADSRNYRLSSENLAVGLSIFIIGLAKKVLIADNIAPYANELFSNPQSPSLFVAWGGVLAYAFQIYFDFSGYSDMAIGLSRLFGIRLPLNFNSPYKAASIIEFWRRWHMTLSRFLRDYLYIALGGNRYGKIRRYTNLMITMLLGGLWHGAGWTFVIWGGLHGTYLVVNHIWVAVAGKLNFSLDSRAWKSFAVALTFASVCFAWVFFRATDLNTAWQIIEGMLGGFGVGIPNAIGARMGNVKVLLEQAGVVFFLGGGARFLETWIWVSLAAGMAFVLPNTQQIMNRFQPALDYEQIAERAAGNLKLRWFPSRRWAISLGVMALAGLLSLNRPSEFLYFQF